MVGFIFGGFLSTVLGQSAFAPPARSQVNLPPYKSNEIISSLITQNVKNGQNTNLDKFKVNNPENYSCRVKVLKEPAFSRMGSVFPDVFDCDFDYGSVWYEHYGGSLLRKDNVKMRVFLLAEQHTIEQDIYLNVELDRSQCALIRVGNHLSVRQAGVTAEISTNNIDFATGYNVLDTDCFVRFFHKSFPFWGVLIDENDEVVKEINTKCIDFRTTGKRYRYKHSKWPSPDKDFIPLSVELVDRESGYVVRSERHHLEIQIIGGSKSSPPAADPTCDYLIAADQFVLSTIFPTDLAAIDRETEKSRLYFRIVQKPEVGFITHTQDHSRPVESFSMKDLQNLKIMYQPPPVAYDHLHQVQFKVAVFDDFHRRSRPIDVWIQIDRQMTDAPRVTWNTGLTLLEGQRRAISNANFMLEDPDSLHSLKFMVTGGLRHGLLLVKGRPSYLFNYIDLLNHDAVYAHDDSDSYGDFIELRIVDGGPPGPQALPPTRFTIPILIMPKDDSPPEVTSNLLLRVRWGQQAKIRRHILDASDLDTSDDYIKLVITEFPKHGQLMIQREWDPVPWPLQESELYQFEIFRGHLLYRHDGSDDLDDSFNFFFRDHYKRQTEEKLFLIRAEQNDRLPPWPEKNCTFCLTMNEDQVLPIGHAELGYLDDFSGPKELTYEIVKSCSCATCAPEFNDPGRIVRISDSLDRLKGEGFTEVAKFTQQEVNHLRLGYEPPMTEIGPDPIKVQFAFKVTDATGKSSPVHTFDLTIKPVDNQPPKLTSRGQEIRAKEGDCMKLTPRKLFELTDPDTRSRDLTVNFVKSPLNGHIGLPLGTPINENQDFTLSEVASLVYCHDGSETEKDIFTIVARDPKDNKSNMLDIHVRVTAINDHQAEFESGLVTRIHVEENGESCLSLRNIDAHDFDTPTSELIFTVESQPRIGRLVMNGRDVRDFRFESIANNQLCFVHRGELGQSDLKDSFFVSVADPGYTGSDLPPRLGFDVSIHRINDAAPRIHSNNALLVVDEGGTVIIDNELLRVSDDDTSLDDIVICVAEQFQHGFLDSIAPASGSEDPLVDKPLNCFPYRQIEQGFIRYNQFAHLGVEPRSDGGAVTATDGSSTSAPLKMRVKINDVNDEPPLVEVADSLQVLENELLLLGDAIHVQNSIQNTDPERIKIHFNRPEHGVILNKRVLDSVSSTFNGQSPNSCQDCSENDEATLLESASRIEPLDDITLKDLNDPFVEVAYVNFGQGVEQECDEIRVTVTDGKHRISKTMTVEIIAKNDECPVVVTNEKLQVELGETRVISNTALHAIDGDSPPSDLLYKLQSLPQAGVLVVTSPGTRPYELRLDESFSEEQISRNQVHYRHNIESELLSDSFTFTVSDGLNTLPDATLDISISGSSASESIHVQTRPLTVREGERHFLTTEELSATDGSTNFGGVTFKIEARPKAGFFAHFDNIDAPLKQFTELDIVSRKVVFVAESKRDVKIDRIPFSVFNNRATAHGFIEMEVIPVDVEMPRMELASSTVFLQTGESIVLSDELIRLSDPDTNEQDVFVILETLPKHGRLIANGAEVYVPGLRVSLDSLRRGQLLYQNNGDSASMDNVNIAATDLLNDGFLSGNMETKLPLTLTLQINHPDTNPPQVVIKKIPEAVTPVTHKGELQYVVIVDGTTLNTADSNSDPSSVKFEVSSPAHGLGHLIFVDSFVSAKRFTQKDVNDGRIGYVVHYKDFHPAIVPTGSFTFTLSDMWGNTSPPQLFVINWPVITLADAVLDVCEGDSLEIPVTRLGGFLESSFVSASVEGIDTAKIGEDFHVRPGASFQIQFDPTEVSKSITIQTMEDAFEEPTEEIRLYLTDLLNATPGDKMKLTVRVHDNHRGKCSADTLSEKRNVPVQINNKQRGNNEASQRRSRHGRVKVARPVGAVSADGTAAGVAEIGSTKVWTFHAMNGAVVREEDAGDFVGKRIFTDSGGDETSPLYSIEDPSITVDAEKGTYHSGSTTDFGRWTDSDEDFVVPDRGDWALRRKRARLGGKALASSKEEFTTCTPSISGAIFVDSAGGSTYLCDGNIWIPKASPQNALKLAKGASCKSADGWRLIRGNCFKKFEQPENWVNALYECRQQGATLAVVHNRRLAKALMSGEKGAFWIGLKKEEKEWHWVTKEPVTRLFWTTKPRTHDKSFFCGQLGTSSKFSAANCRQREAFVCMKRATA